MADRDDDRDREAVLDAILRDEAGGGERVRRCQRDGCEQPAWLCSGCSHEWADVELLRKMAARECAYYEGEDCNDLAEIDAEDTESPCLPCFARRVLRGPTDEGAPVAGGETPTAEEAQELLK